MNDREEIEKLATEYADGEDGCGSDGFAGFVNGFETCRGRIAEMVRDNPNDKILGEILRELFENGIRK